MFTVSAPRSVVVCTSGVFVALSYRPVAQIARCATPGSTRTAAIGTRTVTLNPPPLVRDHAVTRVRSPLARVPSVSPTPSQSLHCALPAAPT
mmetsp:Transcript_39633/g.122542  ORF Transcript_39633/g.122542 Transcript_39633/m.122542 type:complete len:92 (-) Transcript_39633:804-1079(-)